MTQEDDKPKSTKEESNEDKTQQQVNQQIRLTPITPTTQFPMMSTTITQATYTMVDDNPDGPDNYPNKPPPCQSTSQAHYTNFYDAQNLQEEGDHQTVTQLDGVSRNNGSWLDSTGVFWKSWHRAWYRSVCLDLFWFASLHSSCSLDQTTVRCLSLSQSGDKYLG